MSNPLNQTKANADAMRRSTPKKKTSAQNATGTSIGTAASSSDAASSA